MHVFNHTIKPILLYGCEIWSSFNLKSSKYRNGITLEKIFSKSLAERLQLKFYKFILGVHRKSSNFAVFSELGCFPIYFDIVKTTLCYQNRLENLGNKFPVLKASYTESKLNSSKNKPSWYSSSEALCNLVNCSSLINLKPKNFKNKCVAKLRIYFISDWHKTRTNLSDGKLRTYLKYKCSFGPEKYLAILPFHKRKLLTRFRISSHKLMVERGRYKKLDVSQRLCQNCSLNLVEDETHFLFQCPAHASDRNKLISLSSEICLNFSTLQDNEQMIWLLNNENVPVLNNLCNFLAKCT